MYCSSMLWNDFQLGICSKAEITLASYTMYLPALPTCLTLPRATACRAAMMLCYIYYKLQLIVNNQSKDYLEVVTWCVTSKN